MRSGAIAYVYLVIFLNVSQYFKKIVQWIIYCLSIPNNIEFDVMATIIGSGATIQISTLTLVCAMLDRLLSSYTSMISSVSSGR